MGSNWGSPSGRIEGEQWSVASKKRDDHAGPRQERIEQGGANVEKAGFVDQKAAARFERVRELLEGLKRPRRERRLVARLMAWFKKYLLRK